MGIGIKLWGHDGMGKIQRNMVEMEKIHGMVGGNGYNIFYHVTLQSALNLIVL